VGVNKIFFLHVRSYKKCFNILQPLFIYLERWYDTEHILLIEEYKDFASLENYSYLSFIVIIATKVIVLQ